jgi:uncharacterized membrane protein
MAMLAEAGRELSMLVRPRFRHHVLAGRDLLPLFDAVFAVALTLLAYNLPDRLSSAADGQRLIANLFGYGLSGMAVLLYWFKLRRLIAMAGFLRVPQILLAFLCLLTIVLFPKLADIAVLHGDGAGSFSRWTPAQVANTIFLGTLFFFDGLCLLFALSLLGRRHVSFGRRRLVRLTIATHGAGLLFLLLLAGFELLFEWFNNQYLLLVPITLLLEEMGLAWWVSLA